MKTKTAEATKDRHGMKNRMHLTWEIPTPRLFLGLKLLCAFGLLGLSSCRNSSVDYNVPPQAFSATPKSTMSVGDKVGFTFPGAPEYNQVQKVQPDGRVGLPLVGMVTASGRSTSSLQASLTSAYEDHLTDPTVFVSVEEPAAAVYVTGEVGSPGKVPLDRSITALEAVMEVGGFSKLANPKKVYILRTEKGVQKRYVLNLNDPMSGYESQAFYLRPYDVVFVERSNW
jgi:polysaccharide export outer membrane protein